MDDRLKLAEAYYLVASDLQRQGQYMIDVAKNLDQIADRMCAENIRHTQREPPAGSAGVNDGG